MKAILSNPQENGRNLGIQKELVETWNAIAVTEDGLREIVTIRCWMGRSRSSMTVYASIWVHAKGMWASGHGKAGGYHKISAAIDAAMRSAGITLERPIAGVGDSTIEEAIMAVVSACGYDELIIVRN